MAEPCPNQCRSGHLFVNGKWVRCDCLKKRIYKRDLGVFATDTPNRETALIKNIDRSLLIEGPLSQIRNHVAGAFLHMKEVGLNFTSTDAYRLVDIFLDKDADFSNSSVISEFDLYVMLLGFGEVKNQRLPDLIMQVLARRELLQKPTWVILGIPFGQVASRFTSEVHDAMKNYGKVVIK